MNVQCLSCSSRYSVPDAKVQGRKVRIKCKRCGEPILIDGTGLGKAQVVSGNKPAHHSDAPAVARQAVETQPPAQHAAPNRHVTSKKRTMIGMPSAMVSPAAAAQPSATPQHRRAAGMDRQLASSQSQTLLGGVGAMAREPQPAKRAPQRTMLGGLHAPTPPPEDPDSLWVVAVTEEDQRDLSTDQVVALYAAGAIDEGTYVWRDGMDDWCSPFEAPELRRALNAARIAPRQPLDSDEDDDESDFDEHDESVVPSSPLSADRSSAPHPGMWHEPGRLGRDADPNFEDVTVSMNERQTEGLLEKARRADLEEDTPGPAAFRRGAPFMGPRAGASTSGYPVVRQSFEFDDEEVTLAISTTQARAPLNLAERQAPAFELSQRKGSAPPAPLAAHAQAQAPHQQTSQPPAERQETSVAFSLEALTKKSSIPPRPPPAKPSVNPFLEAQAPPQPPQKPVLQPAPRAASSAPPAPQGAYHPAFSYEQAPASARPAPGGGPVTRPTPMPPATPAVPRWDLNDDDDLPVDFRRRKRGRWPLAVALLLCVAVAASYAAKQPLAPWAKLHELTQGRFPDWQELRPPAPPPTTAARQEEPRKTEDTSRQPEPPPQAPVATAEPEAATDKAADKATDKNEPRASKRAPKRARQERTSDSEERAQADSPPSEAENAPDEAEPSSESAEETASGEELPAFDRGAAAEALGAAAASVGSCKTADGPTGIGRAIVTFSNSGRATNANVSGAYAGTGVGTCITQLFQQARVPAFSGPPVKVAKSFTIE